MAKRIDIAFCFNENMYMPAGVAISSLLENRGGEGACHYAIHCVVPEGFPHLARREISELVRGKDPKSTIGFLEANHDFDMLDTGRYSTACFYRLMLPCLLPDLDRIIYADSDMLFLDDLGGLAEFDLGDNLIAAAKEPDPRPSDPQKYGARYDIRSGEWINSGVLIMDLKKIRAAGLYGKWIELARQGGGFEFPDQDIVVITCNRRTAFLPLKYNYRTNDIDEREKDYIDAGIVSRAEFDEAVKSPVVLHYIVNKPWDIPSRPYADIWWSHAARTPFFEVLKLKCLKRLAIDAAVSHVVRAEWRLFGFLPLLVKKESRERGKWYLFGFILLFRVKKKIA